MKDSEEHNVGVDVDWPMRQYQWPIHTHTRSLSYIYIVFQHLLLRLVLMRMQPQPGTSGQEVWLYFNWTGTMLGHGLSSHNKDSHQSITIVSSRLNLYW